MPDAAWKAFERRVAMFFGGHRAAASRGPFFEDVLHPNLYIGCRQRRAVSVVGWWDTAKAWARKAHKVPVLCISEKHRPGFWLLIHSADLHDVCRNLSTDFNDVVADLP